MNIKRKLRQFAVYWAPGPVDRAGATTYAAPVQLMCRWEDSFQDMIDYKGDQWTSKAEIFTEVPLSNLGILWKGKYVDLVNLTDPMLNPGASAIRAQERTPSLNAEANLYSSFL